MYAAKASQRVFNRTVVAAPVRCRRSTRSRRHTKPPLTLSHTPGGKLHWWVSRQRCKPCHTLQHYAWRHRAVDHCFHDGMCSATKAPWPYLSPSSHAHSPMQPVLVDIWRTPHPRAFCPGKPTHITGGCAPAASLTQHSCLACHRPPSRALSALVYTSLCSFMFGWHVHEKAILITLIPMWYALRPSSRRAPQAAASHSPAANPHCSPRPPPTSMLACDTGSDGRLYFFLSTVGHFGLFPLIFKPQGIKLPPRTREPSGC